jgi:hypothetical protein
MERAMGIPHEPDDIPQPYNPVGKAQTLAVWRKRNRIPIPTLEGLIVDLIIVSITETTAVNGLPLECLLETQTTTDAPVKSFGVIFSEPMRLSMRVFSACGSNMIT